LLAKVTYHLTEEEKEEGEGEEGTMIRFMMNANDSDKGCESIGSHSHALSIFKRANPTSLSFDYTTTIITIIII